MSYRSDDWRLRQRGRPLTLASQDTNRKLRDIADELVATGSLPSS